MIKVAWLSGAGFRIIDSQGVVGFVDPWLDAAPGNPGHPFSVAAVEKADLVLVTHGDPGHYGRGDGVRIAAANNCTFASSRELCAYVAENQLIAPARMQVLPMDSAVTIKGWEILMFPAIHPPWTPPAGYPIPRDPNVGFLLTIGDITVLFIGDAVANDDVYEEVSRNRKPLVGLLPIGSPAGSHGTLESTARLAASIARAAKLRYVIPHYNFVDNNPVLQLLRQELASVGTDLLDLMPGQSAEFHAGFGQKI